MAKVTGPLMSLDASGTIGNTVVFSKWKGRNYTRLRVTPKNTKSDAQAKVRTILGLLGKALSFILYPLYPSTDQSQFYADTIVNAPTGQSWISYVIKQIIGTAQSTWDTVSTAFGALDTTHKGYWAAGGASLGLADFTLPYGSFGSITNGEQLYHLAVFATTSLGYSGFATTPDDADATEVSDFVDYCNSSIS